MSIEENAALEAEHDAAVALRERPPLKVITAKAGKWLEGVYVIRAHNGMVDGVVPRNNSKEAHAEAERECRKQQRKYLNATQRRKRVDHRKPKR